MKEKLIEFLKSGVLAGMTDADVEQAIKDIGDFLDSYQPERLNPETRKGCDSLNSMET